MTIEEAHSLVRDGRLTMASRFDRKRGVRQLVVKPFSGIGGDTLASFLKPYDGPAPSIDAGMLYVEQRGNQQNFHQLSSASAGVEGNA
jgi:hypothetical protein